MTTGRGRGTGRDTRHETVHTAAVQGHETAPDPTQVSIPGLTQEQVQRLLSLIDIPKGGSKKLSGKPPWLIDSEASSHMMCDLKQFGKIEPMRPIPICLPNGAHTLAEKQGTIFLEDTVSLNDVLHVPELNCNLLSVARLCKDLNCVVTFFDESCVS